MSSTLDLRSLAGFLPLTVLIVWICSHSHDGFNILLAFSDQKLSFHPLWPRHFVLDGPDLAYYRGSLGIVGILIGSEIISEIKKQCLRFISFAKYKTKLLFAHVAQSLLFVTVLFILIILISTFVVLIQESSYVGFIGPPSIRIEQPVAGGSILISSFALASAALYIIQNDSWNELFESGAGYVWDKTSIHIESNLSIPEGRTYHSKRNIYSEVLPRQLPLVFVLLILPYGSLRLYGELGPNRLSFIYVGLGVLLGAIETGIARTDVSSATESRHRAEVLGIVSKQLEIFMLIVAAVVQFTYSFEPTISVIVRFLFWFVVITVSILISYRISTIIGPIDGN